MTDAEQFSHSGAAKRIREAATRGALSHAIILSGDDAQSAAVYTAAAMQCLSSGVRPCMQCAACRKVLSGIHPDVITVTDDEHKDLSFDVIRAARSDAFIMPNEGQRKVYIFDDSSRLVPRAQNILLKVIEEGPPYAAFVFCTQNTSSLLPTIRSRCVEVKLSAAQGSADADSGAAEEFCTLLCRGKASDAAAFLFRMEGKKLTREDLGDFLEQVRESVASALCFLYGASPDARDTSRALAGALSKTQLSALEELLRSYRRQCEFNIGAGHCLGGLAVELEGILCKK